MKRVIIALMVFLMIPAVMATSQWDCDPTIYYMEGTPEREMGITSEQTCYRSDCYPTADSRYDICDNGWLIHPNGYKVMHYSVIVEMMTSNNPAQVSAGVNLANIINSWQ